MKRTLILLLILILPSLSLAAHKKSLEERVTELEQRNAELYHELEEKKAAGLATKISDRISLSGLIEIEGSLQNDEFANGNSDASSDLTLATAQLGIGAKANDFVSGDLILLFEEGENGDNIAVDEGTINFNYNAISSRVGRQYLPFGNFYSHFISDPLTLELGETQETAVMVSYQQEIWALAGFIFNGDVDKTGDEDHLNNYGFSLTVSPLEDLEFGASYLSDLSDSDAEIVASYTDIVAGFSSYIVAGFGPVTVGAEVLGALDEFRVSDLDSNGDGQGDQPLAWNIEVATQLNDTVELAVRLEGSDEWAEQPELQYGACVSWSPLKQLSLSLEYLHGEFDAPFAPVVSGSPQEDRDLVTAQLAFEF